jgi:hypothetical protein
MIVNIGIPLVGKMEENVYKGNDLVLNISWYRDKKINNILNDCECNIKYVPL